MTNYGLRRVGTVVAAVGVIAVIGGCSPMSWDQKLDALRDAGERGADAHYVLKTQNKPTTKDECNANYQNLGDGTPGEYGGSGSSEEWRNLHTSYFVDSCVSGAPRVPETRPASPSASTPESTAPAPD
ncbi:hypothetical protein [Amycolatopsis antarctica]|uniref:hypothetical protein n=1 Tax=Amycolatopsis antarctica TaxID=1854586 RepID=UPI001054D6D0|nr:hypothetical protein [Amycolatopsis antarctica]